MSETFLHGVEVVEIDDGKRPIRTVRSGIIGVVGTAPDSAPEAAATLEVGTITANNAITFTSELPGVQGNDITIDLRDPRANSAALSIAVTGKAIVVNLATSVAGAISTTATALIAAIAANTDAAALVTAANTGSSTGAGVVTAGYKPMFFSGGADEPFPLNVPVIVAGDQRLAAKLGATGTLPDAMTGIFAQTGAVVVVVRVAEGADEAATMSNIAGGVDSTTGQYKGAMAFLGAESVCGYCPRILIAPGYTHQVTGNNSNPVAANFAIVADRLRAVAVIDGPNTNDAAAITTRRVYGSKRFYFVDVFVTIMKDGAQVNVPASAYVAGLMARIDNEIGFWNSPSNHEIYGIIGTARAIDFTLGDKSSRANLLNESEVATIIRSNGFRLWGNRTTSVDAKWAFLSVVRTADMINDSILRTHMWAVDRNITKTYFKDVAAGVNAYISRLKAQGAIAGGRCWPDNDLNTPESIADGRAYFDFEFTPYPPAERVTFRSIMTNNYLTEVV